ncbi:hypothetical protein GCM10027275_44520 [Rhabdobacter roseus]|uniref:Thiol-disulfide isomerase/thioredoxin n=1 Tax=Rhabdobacter roseus TaxID=1655419 RepID=A0A840TRF7_9BACT|nr:TlpA disulfide reductase family protein [Rhabdobacter roseus]MBB5286491.1 thiol-disulfide isomerase/thioredoxin [Rhabdobacter roseus]
MFQIIVFLLLELNLFQINIETIQKNEVVFIFKEYPKIEKLTSTNPVFFTGIPEVVLWDNSKGLIINPLNKIDTITVVTRDSLVTLRHRYDAVNYFDFVFQNGDTVLFNYVEGMPTPSVLNRKTPMMEFEFDKFFKTNVQPDYYSPLSKLKYLKYFIKIDNKKDSIFIENTISELYLKSRDSFNEQDDLLDSIYKQNNISFSAFLFYKDRIKMQLYSLDLKLDKLTFEEVKQILNLKTNPNNLFPDRYFKEFTDDVREKYFLPNVKKMNFQDGVNRDYREVFEMIENSEIFGEYYRNRLLSKELKLIISRFPSDEYIKYYKKFKVIVKDSLLINHIESEFRSKLLVNNNASYFFDKSLNKFTLKDLKTKHAGKIIYIDFWASWCAPCRAEMPESKQLSEEYTKKGVNFVYVSIDDNAAAWERASKQIGIPDASSYLLPSSKNSTIAKQFNISTIPRYVLIDKDGKVIDADAPRPSDPKIRSLFDKLLK